MRRRVTLTARDQVSAGADRRHVLDGRARSEDVVAQASRDTFWLTTIRGAESMICAAAAAVSMDRVADPLREGAGAPWRC